MRFISSALFRRLSCLLLFAAVLPVQQAVNQMAGISPQVIGLPIDQILISGNLDTQEKWVLKWAGIRRG